MDRQAGEPEHARNILLHRLLVGIVYLLVPIMLLCNWFTFAGFGSNYVRWYVENGSLIAIILAFLALVWKDSPARYDLVAANPARYTVGCLTLLAIFAVGLAALLDARGPQRAALHRRREVLDQRIEELQRQLRARQSGTRTSVNTTRHSAHRESEAHAGPLRPTGLLDTAAILIVGIVLMLAAMAWLVVVAPLNWVLTLLTGAPVRLTQRGSRSRAYANELEGDLTVGVMEAHRSLPASAAEVSLTRDPFAFNQALNAAVIFVLQTIMSRSGW